jgi:hypothetical protein
MALSRRRRREGVGLGIQFTPTIQFGFLVFENFGFPNYSNRSVLQKTKTDMFGFSFFVSVFQLIQKNRFHINQFQQPYHILIDSLIQGENYNS